MVQVSFPQSKKEIAKFDMYAGLTAHMWYTTEHIVNQPDSMHVDE